MDDTTRQLLHDAAPPVATGADFDRLWRQAARQRRTQRIGQVAAAVVLIAALGGLVLPEGGIGSLPLLGGGDGSGVEISDVPVSAPLSEWDIVERAGSGHGPLLATSNQHYALGVFAIEDGRWCVAAATVGGRIDSASVNPTVAQRLLCHELRPPTGDEVVGTVVAIEVGERLVHVAAALGADEMPPVRVDRGGGFDAYVTGVFGAGGGFVPFQLWSTATIDEPPVAFEFHSPTGMGEPMIVEAPEPVPAEVDG